MHIFTTPVNAPAKWEIQHRINDRWYNCWSDNNDNPERFDSFEAAWSELVKYHSAARLAVEDGDIERHMPEDYRITVYTPNANNGDNHE